MEIMNHGSLIRPCKTKFLTILWHDIPPKMKKLNTSLAIYCFSSTDFINSLKHEHSCKILYVFNEASRSVLVILNFLIYQPKHKLRQIEFLCSNYLL